MFEILRSLAPGARVLDLGSRSGSFVAEGCPGALIVRLDLDRPPEYLEGFVQADASRLPFRDRSFDAVIANHSLEHMDNLTRVLSEIGRVVRPEGSVYVAVPDAATLSDRLYRWLYHGGGHINPFRSAGELTEEIARATALPPAGTRILLSSFGYLDRRHFPSRAPRRLWLLGNGNRAFIVSLSYALRVVDRWLGTRTSVYGWAFYFGEPLQEFETAVWTNVCANCGTGHSSASLTCNDRVRRKLMILKSYNCPNCESWNLYTEDRS